MSMKLVLDISRVTTKSTFGSGWDFTASTWVAAEVAAVLESIAPVGPNEKLAKRFLPVAGGAEEVVVP